MHTHRHLRLRETLSERREIWYTDAVQRVLFNGAGFGGRGCGAGARATHVHAWGPLISRFFELAM